MFRTRVLVLSLAGLLLSPLLGNADSPKKGDSAEIIEVRKAFAQCEALRGQETTKHVSLFQVTRDATKAGRWQRNGPAGDEEAAYSTMILFMDNQEIRAADLEQETPSGDWRQSTSYCFRSDGTLAFGLSILTTFQGNVRVEHRRYFDQAGKNIRSLQYVFDLHTNKPVDKEERGFMNREPPEFPTTQAIVDEVGRSNVFQ